MKIALVAIGIPGSGKTTILKPFAEKYGFEYISRDEIRQEIFGDSSIHQQSEKDTVWDEADRRTINALSLGKGVVLDSTFVEVSKRERVITLLREAGATHILGILFDTPLARSQEQNRSREYAVEDEVLETMHTTLLSQPPRVEEGFDAVYTNEQFREFEEGLDID